MSETAVLNLLENLSRLPNHHADLISADLEKELELLKEELSSLRDFLRDVGEIPYKKPEPLTRLKIEIREILHDVEDAIDSALTNNLLRQLPDIRRIRLAKGALKSLRKSEIIRYRATTINIASGTRLEELRTRSTTLPLIGIDNAVGRIDEEKTIICHLLEKKEELQVICITGMDGLGKTTLARKIYLNEMTVYEFPIRIWIYVSYRFNLGDVLRKILRVFTSQDIHSLSDEELTENVRSCLRRKKFLLVLDNIIMFRDWEAIQNALPNSNGMVKVLITSQNSNIFSERGYSTTELRILNDENSWKLLQLKVFGNLGSCPPNLERTGRRIASRCKGLPPQIMVVGGILASQSLTRLEWQMVHLHIVKYSLDYHSFQYEAIKLAYYCLTEDVRECFLYMGVFPRDYEISAWTLTHLWIAEGFVRPNSNESLEETATQILNDLISMSLVMTDAINSIGQVKTCRLDYMSREFCIYNAREHNLFNTIGCSEEDKASVITDKPHRLCVHSRVTFPSELLNAPVRSLLYLDESPIRLHDSSPMSAALDAFKLLKVLDSKSTKFHKIPGQITKLFHLRYVTLSIDDLNVLPESFSKLWNLQTLVVDTKSRVITIEANIWSLIRLRHLKTNAAIVLSEHEKGAAGENLQTLYRLSPKSCTADVFERACNLKTLGIRGDFSEEMFFEKLKHLEKLKLMNDSSENPMCHLPHPIRFPPNLKWLTLTKTYLLWDCHMPILTKIKNLKVLKLKEDAFTGVIWRAASGDCFPHLEVLHIENVDLVLWEAPADYLPRLKSLVLKNCENLREIPAAVEETCLEKLEIEHLGKSAVAAARRIGQKQRVQRRQKAESESPFKLFIGPGCY